MADGSQIRLTEWPAVSSKRHESFSPEPRRQVSHYLLHLFALHCGAQISLDENGRVGVMGMQMAEAGHHFGDLVEWSGGSEKFDA